MTALKLIVLAAYLFASAIVHGADRPAAPPNIVVLLADDQGWGDLSLNGNRNVTTPNIDSIGRSGAMFDRFYVCSVCAPTRAEFFTGRYHPRTGVRGVSTGLERMNVGETTIADSFKAAGYATGIFGKWHNGSQWPYHPNARGFDEFYGFTSGHWAEYFDALLEHNGKPVRGRGYIADDLTEHAMEFIARNRARPFFCYVPYNTPHSPFCVPDKHWNRYKDDPIAQRGPDGENERLDATRCVLAMTENLDFNVGRILRQLEELKLSDNTIVVYFSDNGPATSVWNGGMKGRKGSTDEGGLRVPLLIRWPGQIPAGTHVREIASVTDLLPTLTQLAGVKRVGAAPLDGRDISALLKGAATKWPDRKIFSHHNGQVSVRTQRHRLDSRGALFDLESDPGQETDIRSSQPAIAAALTNAVAGWRREVFGANQPVAVSTTKTAKGKTRVAAIVPDDRPYPVGYAEFPWTPLPARDGVPHGSVRRSATSPNSTFFTNWTSTGDRMTWDIEVNRTGNYQVEVHYTCAAADLGSIVEISFNGARATARVTEAWDPPFRDQNDRVPRTQSQMKEFRPLSFGSVRLEKGCGLLTLQAPEIAGKQVMDVRLVALTLEK
jgi:arylsulfatase A-like enzyme